MVVAAQGQYFRSLPQEFPRRSRCGTPRKLAQLGYNILNLGTPETKCIALQGSNIQIAFQIFDLSLFTLLLKDDRDIRAGEDWPNKLRDELEARKVLIEFDSPSLTPDCKPIY
jgi:hypothetical protein